MNLNNRARTVRAWMRHASIEPGRMVASEYRLPLTRCLALADLTQEKPPTGGFFVLWVLVLTPGEIASGAF